jgi:hypothetical protein
LELDPKSRLALAGVGACDFNLALTCDGQQRRELILSAYGSGLASLKDIKQVNSDTLFIHSIMVCLSEYLPRQEALQALISAKEDLLNKKHWFLMARDKDELLIRLEFVILDRSKNDDHADYVRLNERIEKCLSRRGRYDSGHIPFEQKVFSGFLEMSVDCLCVLAMNADNYNYNSKMQLLEKALERARGNIELVGETSGSVKTLAVALAYYSISRFGGTVDSNVVEVEELIQRIENLSLMGSFRLATVLSVLGRHEVAMAQLKTLARNDILYPIDKLMYHNSFKTVRARPDYNNFIAAQLERLGKEWGA